MKINKKNKKQILYILPVTICLIVSFSFLLIDYNLNNKESILWGKANSNFKVDYKVYTNDDKFYDEKYLDEYGSYVTSITDKIDFDIQYTFETTKNINVDYTYELYGEVVAEIYESGKTTPIWSDKLEINDEVREKLGNSNYIALEKKVSIPFKEYNEKMIEYKNNYKLNVTPYVKFRVAVNINSLDSINSNISNKDVLTVKIPLLQPTFNIDINKSISSDRDIYEVTNVERDNTYITLGMGSLLFTFVMSLVLFIIYKNTKNKNELYQDEENQILKKYEEIIIKIDGLPSVEDLEIIELSDFNDLIDIEETVKMPIMYLNIQKNKESWFMIIHNNYFYRYKFKNK